MISWRSAVGSEQGCLDLVGSSIDKGVTNTRRAMLSDGQITHDAQIQTVDISKALFEPARGPRELGFKDTYRYNIAGYRLARLLGLANVPLGRRATVTRAGQAVRLDHDELFDVLADHVDLLQGFFSGLLQANEAEAVSTR